MQRLLAWVLLLLIRRVRRRMPAFHPLYWQRVVTFEGKFLFWRFEPFWNDEWINGDGKHWNRPPWWRPFNALLHLWKPAPGTREGWHDHPRWSITICLRGKMIEHTPWGDNVLTPGSVVFRSRKYIHAFSIPDGYSGKTWTLFIVGRRNHRQNTYVVTPQGCGTAHRSQDDPQVTEAALRKAVGRFLGWKLPQTFGPDCGISFNPSPLQKTGVHPWPIGTNLLTAEEARAMLQHVLGVNEGSGT